MTADDPGLPDYGMFSEAGNLAVWSMLMTARARTRDGVPEGEVLAFVDRQVTELYSRGYREVRDTAVREAILVELDEAWRAAYGHGRIARLPASGVPGSRWFYHG